MGNADLSDRYRYYEGLLLQFREFLGNIDRKRLQIKLTHVISLMFIYFAHTYKLF